MKTEKELDDFKLINDSAFKYISSNSNKKTILSCSSDSMIDKIESMSKEAGLLPMCIKNIDQLTGPGLYLTKLRISEIAIIDDAVFIPESIITGKKISNGNNFSKYNKAVKKSKGISPGSFIVHKNYGVGKFLSIEIITAGNITKECLRIEYANNDILYVTVDDVDQIDLYDDGERDDGFLIQLDSLRSSSWKTRRNKAEHKIQKIAHEIIVLAKARLEANSHTYVKSELYDLVAKMERGFHFIETEDQMNAINAVYDDLASGKTMNRLICGDVGFGKTEVSMRAAFLVACGKICGKKHSQVAFLCPSLFLAQQHYENISKRFAEFDINIKLVSRLTSKKECEDIISDLKNGSVDILIGTHSILNDKFAFKDLGLIICDEEQLFGVEHKEKFKKISTKAHCLTMTATPIPRTLQSALHGISDISIISTPPFGRMPIKTSVITLDKSTIEDIIIAEKSRGGQTIIITPKIADIEELERKISAILTNIKTVSIHSKLGSAKMDEAINLFYAKKCDIMIATTIVATGMDFGNSNTIIINKPEMFGLSQLYQIRGRVGRRDKQAYCYLLVSEKVLTNKEQMYRLSTLQTLNSAGSSFAISNADLDMRGGGNILGKEQSGVILEIGPKMYYDLLNDAINKGNEKHISSDFNPEIDLGVSVHMPSNYIIDAETRIEFYRKISEVDSENDILSLKSEMRDRFGGLPSNIDLLFELVKIKSICKTYKIPKLKMSKTHLNIYMEKDTKLDIQKIIEMVKKGDFKLQPDKLSIPIKGESESLEKISSIINKLGAK